MRRPAVSIGLPVYNGENFLREAVDSILGQSFDDFELIISDNASTDATESWCRAYAERDPRIRYSRLDENLGAAANYNRTFGLATGRYFKWAAHDDVLHSGYLERCVEALDGDPGCILAHCLVQEIDERGEPIDQDRPPLRVDSDRPEVRYHDVVMLPHRCIDVFGVMRPQVFRQTRLHETFLACDRVLLAELALRGRWHIVPEVLFYRRFHPDMYSLAYTSRLERLAWFDPGQEGRIYLPAWYEGYQYLRRPSRVDVGWRARWSCRRTALRWHAMRRRRLVDDFRVVSKAWLGRTRLRRRLLGALVTAKRAIRV